MALDEEQQQSENVYISAVEFNADVDEESLQLNCKDILNCTTFD